MSLEIDLVSHCWHYSRSLAYQISGLILDPPDFPVQLTIFCNPEDKDTINTIQTLYPKLPPTVCLVPRAQDKPKLFRRGIGRNDACLGTLAASVVICTDCDYVWGAKALFPAARCRLFRRGRPVQSRLCPGVWLFEVSKGANKEGWAANHA